MQVFGQNPNRIVDGYSEELEAAFLEHVKRSHGFSRVAATVMYNEYIADRHHVHMNSMQWKTLTEFVKYLGRTEKCKVEEAKKGWFVTCIDRESEALFKEKMKNKRARARADIVDEEKQERGIRRQIGRAEQLMPEGRERLFGREGVWGKDDGRNEKNGAKKFSDGKSVFDDLMREEEKVKEVSNKKDYLLCEGTIVKVMSKALANKGYSKKKGL
ncbi:hypothetical protein Droror1_Dr00022725 [Drosera rotundifolia]